MSSFNAGAVSLASPRREDDFTGDDEALATGQGWQTLATGLEDTGQAWKTLARPGRHWPLSWQTLATPGRHWPRLEDTGHWSGILCPLAWQTLARPGRHVLARPGRHGPGQGNMGEVPAGGQDSQDRHNTSLIRIFYIYIFFFKYKKLLATRDP